MAVPSRLEQPVPTQRFALREPSSARGSVSPQAAVWGSVRALGGGALQATVCVLNATGGGNPFSECTNTDSFGRFALANLPVGARAVLASARGYRSCLHAMERDAASHGDLLLELESGGAELAGQVVDAIGGPVAGALVSIRADSRGLIAVVASGEDGSFALHDDGGIVELCARAEAYSVACREVAVPSAGHVLMLTPASTIVGEVRDQATEAPLAGVSVVASNRDGLRVPARTTSTGESGSFTLEGLPGGGYEVVAVSNSWRSAVQWVSVGLGQTSAPITLWATSAVRLSGLVLLDGKACRNGAVQLSGPIWLRENLGRNGTVDIDGLTPGRYEATADCEGAPPRTSSLEVQGSPLRHTWELEGLPGSAISPPPPTSTPDLGSLRITLKGEPRAPVRVFAESGDGVTFQGQPRGGSFVVEDLPPGEYRVHLDDDFEHAQRVRLMPGDALLELRLTATAPRWIHGRVLDENDSLVGDAWVTYARSDSPALVTVNAVPVLTDELGAFQLPALPGVLYSIGVASPAGNAHLDEVKADDDVVMHVSQPASLSGTVQTEAGQPVPEFTLNYGETRQRRYYVRHYTQSTFQIPMLEPGVYSLRVTSPLGAASRELSLHPREQSTLRITLSAREEAVTD